MQGAQERRMHDVLSLVKPTPVLQPEAIMKMLSPEVRPDTTRCVISYQLLELGFAGRVNHCAL